MDDVKCDKENGIWWQTFIITLLLQTKPDGSEHEVQRSKAYSGTVATD
jgi:hypothetical protein